MTRYPAVAGALATGLTVRLRRRLMRGLGPLTLIRAGNAGNPDALRQWFNDGADGQINWGSEGDFDACVEVASQYMDDDQAKGFCNERHQDAVGGPPGSED